MKINDIVQTPNGPARLVSTYYLGHEGPEEPPEGVSVRHPKGADIDLTKCASAISETNTSGSQVGRSIIRGVLGSIFGRKR